MKNTKLYRSFRVAVGFFVFVVILCSASEPIEAIKAGLIAAIVGMLFAWVLYCVDYFRGGPNL